MGLPKIEMPLFELTVPSTKEKIKYRPYTVKEEKILLIAQESKDFNQMMLAIEQLLTNCIMDGVSDVSKLAMFDIEFIMMAVRARSVNNVIEFRIKDPDNGDPVDLEFDIEELEVEFPEKDYSTIVVSEDYVIKMRYPSIKEMAKLQELNDATTETLFDIIMSCVDSVINGEQVYKLSDFSQKEVAEFIDELPKTAVDSMRDFFDYMPRLRYEAKWTNKDGEEKKADIEGLETFFY